MLHKKLQFTEL